MLVRSFVVVIERRQAFLDFHKYQKLLLQLQTVRVDRQHDLFDLRTDTLLLKSGHHTVFCLFLLMTHTC